MNPATVDIEKFSFSQFADAFLDLHRKGKTISVDEAVDAFPHLEREIRERLPSLLMLEQALGAEQKQGPKVDTRRLIAGCFLGEQIGKGAFGVVYRGTQPALNREVAVKVVPLPQGPSVSNQRFELESQAIGKLEHPHIVQAYAFTKDDENAYLVMRLVEGFSFQQMLHEQCGYAGTVMLSNLRNDWKAFAQMAANVASALEHAHKNGLIHRDIKPSNLMLDKNSHVWVTDFGLAKVRDYTHSLSMTGDLIGTPRYMAPEQFRGVSNEQSDIYSLGLTLYEIATGTWARESRNDIPNSQGSVNIRRALRDNSDMPASLAGVIDKACAFSPEDRYQSAAELRVVFERFVAGQVPDRRKQRRKPDDVFRRQSKMKLGAIGAGFITLLFGFMSYNSATKRPEPEAWKQEEFALPAEEYSLLDQLADTPDADLPMVVKDVAREMVLRSTKNIHMSNSERIDISNRISTFIESIESGEAPPESLLALFHNYKNSRLALATKFTRAIGLVERSGFSAGDKTHAQGSIRAFVGLVLEEKVPEEHALGILSALTYGKVMTYREFLNSEIPDSRLRDWIRILDGILARLGRPDTDLTPEFDKLFSGLDGDQAQEKASEEIMQSTWNQLPPEARQRMLEELRRVQGATSP